MVRKFCEADVCFMPFLYRLSEKAIYIVKLFCIIPIVLQNLFSSMTFSESFDAQQLLEVPLISGAMEIKNRK
jgi:hypothetical protein